MHTILHIDMDAFFAAVELLDQPALKGKPLVIGSPPDKRGVVSTASYEARKFGVHSAMPSRTAFKLCPQAVFLPVRMERYLEVSAQVMAIVESFTPLVEQVSVDEAFLDVRGAMRKWKDPVRLARALKERIRKEVGITASVGVAGNKFLAKLASDLEKPDGLTVLPEDGAEVIRFLAPLSVTKIWGVGKVSAERLERWGIRTMGDVQQLLLETLTARFGANFALHLHELAHGRDERAVVTAYEAKSISSENTFDEDCGDPDVVKQSLIESAEHVGMRLRRGGLFGRVAHIKLRFADFTTITRQRALPVPTQSDRDLLAAALALWDAERVKRPIRLVGFGVSGLDETVEEGGYLFQEFNPRKAGKLDQALDNIRSRFGTAAVRRGVAQRNTSSSP